MYVLPTFPSTANVKIHNISKTPRIFKKVLMNLDSQGIWSSFYSSGGSRELWV